MYMHKSLESRDNIDESLNEDNGGKKRNPVDLRI